MQKLALFTILLFLQQIVAAQPFTLKGIVLDEYNEHPLANVKVRIAQDSTETDERGYFVFHLSEKWKPQATLYFEKEHYESLRKGLLSFQQNSQSPILFYLRYKPDCKCEKK